MGPCELSTCPTDDALRGPWRAQYFHACICKQAYWNVWCSKSFLVGLTHQLLTLQPQYWRPPPVVPPGLRRTFQRPSTYFSFNWVKSSIVISPWPSLAMTTPTSLFVSFIWGNIDFALLVVNVPLRDYSIIIRILMIHLLLALELENFDWTNWLQYWGRLKVSPQPWHLFF